MSEEDLSNTDEGLDASKLDASMTVDSSSLSSEEADFARQMGFGADEDDDSEPDAAPRATDTEPVVETPSPASDEVAEDSDDADDETDAGTESESETVDASAETSEPQAEPEPEPEVPESEDRDADEGLVESANEDADAEKADSLGVADNADNTAGASSANDGQDPDLEEIHPRASADGMQSTLEARADELLGRDATAGTTTTTPTQENSGASAGANTAALDENITRLQSQIDQSEKDQVGLRRQLEERETELASLRSTVNLNADATTREEKENEELRTEVVSIGIDRDHLIDQLAVTSGRLVQSDGRIEKLEASLRAARGALTPLPEGERALRAEVIGLRGRIEEANEEYQSLAGELSQNSTELAIARARVEDRQHEVNSHVERIEELDERLSQNEEVLATTVGKHREILAMSTRLQADNNELRSAQAALEETLQARDLEILAREEHLSVTRQGLSARDIQLVDVNERLEQEQNRCEAQQADLSRSEIERDQLLEKIAHRESRIATLTETIIRIEEAMGHPIPRPDTAAREMPQAEWSRPVLSQHVIRSKAKPTRPTENPASIAPTAAESAEEAEAADEPHADDDLPSEIPSASEEVVQPAVQPETTTPIINQVAFHDAEAEAEAALSHLDPVEDVTESCSSAPTLSAPPMLPSILSSWRDRRFGEMMGTTFAGSVHTFLAERLQKHFGEPGPEYLFLKSLGGSLLDAEVHFVQALQQLGVEGIRMDVLDADPLRAEARQQKIELAGLGEIIDSSVGDLDDWDADAPVHAILLSDALDSQPGASDFLDHINESLTSGALILFVDRIASGPIQLSASALIRLEELWDVLPESLAGREGLSIVPHRGDDGGFGPSVSAAADLLRSRLDPIVMAGFGHLADLIVGPTRGGTLSVEDDEAMQLLESIMAIDESRSVTENLAPRHGLAVFSRGSAGRTEILGQAWPSQSADE